MFNCFNLIVELFKEKAKELAVRLNIHDFEASQGWLSNLKQRHSITLHSEQGEAGAVNIESLEEWRQTVLKFVLTEFSPENVFNADETGLFWQLLPNKTLAFKGSFFDNNSF